ncbi:Uncharacterized [Moorella glycerini]|uniref:Uncharacterized protein n=1 Tax=Neomoorella stamsii TaxID=1266720 RepID=A0A9X7J5Y4_9FIRM|nr:MULTISPECIES: hypothetical protein [Moorella]PRR76327.1 hypothetical protein MOST_04880 [Moorella stamsii]CEP67105.1 Uncharacterized [Moorella glycerini]
MFLNKIRVKELMQEKANGNYHEFARQLDVDVAQVYRILTKNSKAGPKFLGRFMRFCQDNGLDFRQYIFLEEPLHICNNTKDTGTEG